MILQQSGPLTWYDWRLIKSEIWTWMCTLRQHHVNMKAEIWVLHLQAKNAKACQQITKTRGEAKTDSPSKSSTEIDLDIMALDL